MAKTNVIEIPRKRTDLEYRDGGVIVHDERELWLMAMYSAKKFRKTGNPVYAIESFGQARLAGRVPPKSILAWIGECFDKWYLSRGKASLDKIMGLSGRRGKDPAYKAAQLERRNTTLYYDMARLTRLGATIDQAATMVGRKLEESKGWNKTGWRLGAPNSDSLAQGFKRWPMRREAVELYQKHFPELSVPNQAKYLKTFPKDSLPMRFRVVIYP